MDVRTMTPEELLGPLNEVERTHAPTRLFVAGDVALLRHGSRVSVVGSRAVSPEGATRARSLTKALVKRGIIVVSGLAAGVDTVAHETAVSEGGRTVAVLGTPLEETFPAKNRALQARLMREQLVVSQFAAGAPTQRKNFPMRTRTMALITDATVIVEAGAQSGTLHQGWEALRLGRLLFLMESVAHSPTLCRGGGARSRRRSCRSTPGNAGREHTPVRAARSDTVSRGA
jgi:DNA processing protein